MGVHRNDALDLCRLCLVGAAFLLVPFLQTIEAQTTPEVKIQFTQPRKPNDSLDTDTFRLGSHFTSNGAFDFGSDQTRAHEPYGYVGGGDNTDNPGQVRVNSFYYTGDPFPIWWFDAIYDEDGEIDSITYHLAHVTYTGRKVNGFYEFVFSGFKGGFDVTGYVYSIVLGYVDVVGSPAVGASHEPGDFWYTHPCQIRIEGSALDGEDIDADPDDVPDPEDDIDIVQKTFDNNPFEAVEANGAFDQAMQLDYVPPVFQFPDIPVTTDQVIGGRVDINPASEFLVLAALMDADGQYTETPDPMGVNVYDWRNHVSLDGTVYGVVVIFFAELEDFRQDNSGVFNVLRVYFISFWVLACIYMIWRIGCFALGIQHKNAPGE